MFWSIFLQCTLLIGTTVIVGGVIGHLVDRSHRERSARR